MTQPPQKSATSLPAKPLPAQPVKPSAPVKTPGQLQAEKSAAEAAEAAKFDKKGGGKNLENTTVVDFKGTIIEPSTALRDVRLSEAQVLKMEKPEVLAVGIDRGYWKGGREGHKGKKELVAHFLVKQAGDKSLREVPLTVGKAVGSVGPRDTAE